MTGDVERVARALWALSALKVSQTSEYWLRYRQENSWTLFVDEARAAMVATREIDAEAMRELAKSRPYVSENENLRREESINITADWLLQRAKGVTDDQ